LRRDLAAPEPGNPPVDFFYLMFNHFSNVVINGIMKVNSYFLYALQSCKFTSFLREKIHHVPDLPGWVMIRREVCDAS
jgi:hypothetical protein